MEFVDIQICFNVISGGATARMTKSRSPNGGCIRPTSNAMSRMTLSQNMSRFIDFASCTKNGSVRSIMAICSMKHPRTMRITTMLNTVNTDIYLLFS